MTILNETGLKVGWVGGWAGCFAWVAIVGVVFLFQEKYLQGFAGVLLAIAAFVLAMLLAPWRHQGTPFWKLMFAPYCACLLVIAWAIASFDNEETVGLNWWNLLWIVPMITPMGVLGNRKWEENNKKPL